MGWTAGTLSTSLSRYLGANMELTSPMTLDLQTVEFTLTADERLILCSDGVSSYIADEAASVERLFADQCTRSPIHHMARESVNLANQRGGWDKHNLRCLARYVDNQTAQ